MEIRDISLDVITPPPVELRSTVDQEYIEALAGSIKDVGILQPLKVQPKDEHYEIVFGNCRYLAAKVAGLAKVPCIIVEEKEVDTAAETIHENLIRQDVSHWDIAKYLAHLRREQKLSVEELARKFRYSTGWVYQHLKILEADLPIQEAIDADILNYQAGLELMRIPNAVTRQALTESAIKAGASLSVVKSWVATELARAGLRPSSPPVSQGAAMNKAPELTFTCACCKKIKPTTDMVMIRTCSECYIVAQKAMKLLGNQTEEKDD